MFDISLLKVGCIRKIIFIAHKLVKVCNLLAEFFYGFGKGFCNFYLIFEHNGNKKLG